MSAQIDEMKKLVEDLERRLKEVPQLKQVGQKIGFPVVYLIGGVLVLLAVLIYVASGFSAIVNLVAFVYPAWASLKAIRSENKEDDTLWLAYWVFYGFFAVIESITDMLLFWIPFYELLKMCFYVYLYQAKGALILYHSFLEPIVVKLETTEKKAKEEIKNIKNRSKKMDLRRKRNGAQAMSRRRVKS